MASLIQPNYFVKLAARYNVTVYEVPSTWMDNHEISYSAGADTIWLGTYSDVELRLISFFHELGHCLDVQRKTLPAYEDLPYYHFNEASAWKTGLALAEKEGVKFSKPAIRWAKKQLNTYFGDGSKELTPIKYLVKAKKYAFRANQ